MLGISWLEQGQLQAPQALTMSWCQLVALLSDILLTVADSLSAAFSPLPEL